MFSGTMIAGHAQSRLILGKDGMGIVPPCRQPRLIQQVKSLLPRSSSDCPEPKVDKPFDDQYKG
jgi:hypothetical protein